MVGYWRASTKIHRVSCWKKYQQVYIYIIQTWNKDSWETMGTMGNIGNLEAPCRRQRLRPAIKLGQPPRAHVGPSTFDSLPSYPLFPPSWQAWNFKAKMGETPMERNGGILFLDGKYCWCFFEIPVPTTWDPGGAKKTPNRSWDYLPTSSGESRISEPSTAVSRWKFTWRTPIFEYFHPLLSQPKQPKQPNQPRFFSHTPPGNDHLQHPKKKRFESSAAPQVPLHWHVAGHNENPKIVINLPTTPTPVEDNGLLFGGYYCWWPFNPEFSGMAIKNVV